MVNALFDGGRSGKGQGPHAFTLGPTRVDPTNYELLHLAVELGLDLVHEAFLQIDETDQFKL